MFCLAITYCHIIKKFRIIGLVCPYLKVLKNRTVFRALILFNVKRKFFSVYLNSSFLNCENRKLFLDVIGRQLSKKMHPFENFTGTHIVICIPINFN